jgi:PKD repeat protein
MKRRMLAFLVAVVAAAGSVQAQPTGIDHKAVACIVVAKYPKLKACFGAAVVEPRAYFHAEGVHDWYWVKMATDLKDAPGPFCYAGILPKPSRKLIHKHIEYYLENVGKGERTREYDPLVVRQARECKKDAPVAPISPTGPTAVFPAMPAEFTVGGVSTAAVGLTTAAAAATGTGVYFATRKDQTPPASTPTVPAPAPAAPVAPPPPPPTPPPVTPPLGLSCQAEPRSGQVPLTVTFTAFASGGTGSYDYDWRFGDGGTGVGRHPVHTYTSRGTFDVVLIVTSGDLVRRCERSITVSAPPAPTPSPSASPTVSLTFTSVDKTAAECGKPFVNISPPNSNCGGTDTPGTKCSHTYPVGTVVKLTADDLKCGDFICWGGDCSGTPPISGAVCTLTMNTDRSANATFLFSGPCAASAEPPASLSWSIDLDAPGAIGQAVVDGQVVVAATGQRAQQVGRIREGDAVVAATLVKADGKPGTWRFEAQPGESIEAGSLRVLQGEVALLTPTAVVFRLKGDAGERVSFSYRLRR